MFRKLDDLLNGFTMYRVLAYGLSILALLALLFNLLGVMTLNLAGMLLSLTILLAACYITNRTFAKIWQVPSNNESWFITGLILFFILPQANTVNRALLILLAGIVAMASKYLINWQGKHLFNPAAFAAVVLGVTGLLHANWWVGSSVLWPFTLAFGLVVVRKIRRFPLMLSFAFVSIITTVVVALLRHIDLGEFLPQTLAASPLIFLGTIMLTEPATMPPVRGKQVLFGALVGVLYAGQFKLGGLFIYPELALLIGNLYAFAVSPRYRLRLQLKEIQKVSDRVHNFVFTPDRKLAFQPGQYLEWTLGHQHQDDRGNRRTFSIASSPTEKTIQLGVTFSQPASSYKKTLQALKPGDFLYAGQLAGNFLLPKDVATKLVFVAGGVGITPFRSMLKYLADTKESRDIILFYLVNTPGEIAYKDVLERAAQAGVRVVPVVTKEPAPKSWHGETGLFDQEFVTKHVPDYTERTFYLSGPQGMIENHRAMLRRMGVEQTHIETDYFPGY